MSSYIGLISGTSMDGVDAALVSFENETFVVHATSTTPYPASLRSRLADAIRPDARLSVHEFGSLHVGVGLSFALAANEIISAGRVQRDAIVAIGSHGQTLRHSPDSTPPYTLQIGDAGTIATRCKLPTVADFRSLDVAAGGQGAPLVPPFHEAYFRVNDLDTIVLNIGGIANITVLPGDPDLPARGFDTGPGNCLLDEWVGLHRQLKFDDNGNWARTGKTSPELLRALMADPYILRKPAKSTGREYFNLDWLNAALGTAAVGGLRPEDIQSTLLDFTAESIAAGISDAGASPHRVLVCGGGASNAALMDSLRVRLGGVSVESIASVGADPDSIEAIAFAWLAHQRMREAPVRLTTSAIAAERLLGAVYLPSGR